MILGFLWLAACDGLPSSIVMTGTVADAPYGEGTTVAGAHLEVLDSQLAPFSSADADADGAYTLTVPAGVQFFVSVTADGYTPSASSGTAGVRDFAAPPGYPWVASDGWIDALRAEFAACPTALDEGAIVAGEIRANLDGVAWVDSPFVTTGSVRVLSLGSVETAACYLDDDGESVADATLTGDTGRFAVFGVPAGEIVVDVRYEDPSGEEPVELYRFVAPDAGFVPIYPALVQILY